MKFIPKENLHFKTKLSEGEVKIRIAQNIEPEKLIRLRLFGSGKTKPYEGRITGNTFSIKRIIRYRNSFLPRIIGNIERDSQGTTIKVKMRLQIWVQAFLLVWCSGAVVGLFFIAKNVYTTKGFDPWFFMPIGMLIFVYFLALFAFRHESGKSKIDLKTYLEAEMTEL